MLYTKRESVMSVWNSTYSKLCKQTVFSALSYSSGVDMTRTLGSV